MIYIITHKKVKITPPKRKGYRMLQVGAKNNCKVYDLTDDTGENISSKNSTFCELTGLYWIWKNCNDPILGLVHYRRFFVYPVWYKIAGRIPLVLRLVSINYAKHILKRYDCIVANKFTYKTSVWENYSKEHNESDLKVLRQVIKEKYPQYISAFDLYFKGNEMYGCNMLIAKRTFVERYCEWLFDILFEVEKRIDISNYSVYQKRVFGFLAERMFNICLYKNKIKVYSASVDFIEET